MYNSYVQVLICQLLQQSELTPYTKLTSSFVIPVGYRYKWGVGPFFSPLLPKCCIKQITIMAILANIIHSAKKFKKNLKIQNNPIHNCHIHASKDASLERRPKTKPAKDEIDSSTNALEPAGYRLEVSSQSEKLKPSLWNRAYDDLKKTDGQLVEEYEKLLSTQLQTNTGQKPCIPTHSKFHS